MQGHQDLKTDKEVPPFIRSPPFLPQPRLDLTPSFSTFSEVPLDPLFPDAPSTSSVLPPTGATTLKRALVAEDDLASSVILPPRPSSKPLLDGLGDEEDEFSTGMFFGGNTVGMGRTESPSAAMVEEAPRKRLRRGGPGALAAEETGSGVTSSSQSRVTSPADSQHSSAQDITSPAEEGAEGFNSTLGVRDHLSRFKVDSAPSSSASSAYGGTTVVGDGNVNGNGVKETEGGESKGKGREAVEDERESNTAGQGDTVAPESSPVQPRPLGRLVRGKRQAPPPPADVIDLRSPPTPVPAPFATYSSTSLPMPMSVAPAPNFAVSPSRMAATLPPFATAPTAPSPVPFATSNSNYNPIPTSSSFIPHTNPFPVPRSFPTPPPAFRTPPLSSIQQAHPHPHASGPYSSQQTHASGTPPPAVSAAGDPAFQAFALSVGNGFPRDEMVRAWYDSGRDQDRATARLVQLQDERVQAQDSQRRAQAMQMQMQQQQQQQQMAAAAAGGGGGALRFPQPPQQQYSMLPQPGFPMVAPRSTGSLVYPSYSELIGAPRPTGVRPPHQPQPRQYPQAVGTPPIAYPHPQNFPSPQGGKILYAQQSPQQQHQQYVLQQQHQQQLQQQRMQAQYSAYPNPQPSQPYPGPISIPNLAGSAHQVHPHPQYHQYTQGSSSGAQRLAPALSPQQKLAQSLAMNPIAVPKKKKRNANMSDSDDGGEYSEGSGDEYGGPSAAALARAEAHALAFFNACSKEEMSELAGCNPAQATLVIKLRPFTSTDDFRARTRKQKGVGNQLMDNYIEVVQGMNEVDKVLNECEEIGNQLSRIMDIWAGGDGATQKMGGSSTPTTTSGLGGDVGLAIVTISEDEVEKKLKASQDPEVISAFANYLRKQPDDIPEGVVLKDYQMLGLNWLNLLYLRKTSCILADEMGLGKTAQIIALMAHLKANGEKGPHLVIVPSSTLENWMREFSVFAPGLVVASYYGSQADRAEIRHELKSMTDLDVVVTTYNIATSSSDDQKFLKKKMNFQMAVFDEGHQLKNSQSKKYKDLMQIRTKWRCLLTGTPLQNNLQELVSLLSFILPDQFRDANESLRAIFKAGPGSQVNMLSRARISRAKKMMTPFVLRRKKAHVLKDLPKKTERIEYCEMTPLQEDVYNEALTRSKKALLDVGEEDLEALIEEGPDETEEKEEKPKKKKEVKSSTKTGNKSDGNSGSNVLMDLRKASNHPMLFRRLYTDRMLKAMAKECLKELEFTDRDKDLILEDMEVMTDFELHRFCGGYKHLKKYCLKKDEWMSAGKIHALQRLLPELKENGDRVLLFSQFTQVLDILEVVLNTLEIKYLKLTGQTAVTERQGLVDEYSNDPDITVFLLSTRAGGLGLNLTTANTVIFYDQDYNPHNDKQAEDRSYRIGQVRDVSIIKLITKGSLDEDMYQLGKNKLLLDSSVSSTAPEVVVEEDEGNSGQAEKKMRTSLLSNLKKKFAGEAVGPGSTQLQSTQEVKED